MRRPPVVLAMAAITALALIVAVALILFSVNPTTHENQESIRAQQAKLTRSVHELNEIICSQAQTTANAYRFRSLTPSGRVEPIRHFLTRMQAQRQTLELSQGRKCPVAPGFPPFEYQLERALKQIEHILGLFDAQQRKPVDRGVSTPGIETPNQLQVSPRFGIPSFIPPPASAGNHGGIGDEGVPYIPPKTQKPNQPPSRPESTQRMPIEREPRSASLPLTSNESPESPSGSAGSGENPVAPTRSEVEKVTEDVEEELCSAIRQIHHLC